MFRSIQEGQSCNVPECFRMCKPISRCPCAQWPPGATAAAVDSPGGPSRSADPADLQILQIQQICRSSRSGRSGRSRQIPADPADLGRSGRSGRFRLGSADCHDLLEQRNPGAHGATGRLHDRTAASATAKRFAAAAEETAGRKLGHALAPGLK
jgi:hypothetical protein